MNILMFQGVYLPLREWEYIKGNLSNEILNYIDPNTIKRFENNQASSLYDLTQMIHAINISKFLNEKEKLNLSNKTYYSGFSVGIYAALFASGELALDESFDLVKKRAIILMDAVDNNWDIYSISGTKTEVLKSIENEEDFYISTISSKRHVSIAIKRDSFEKVYAKLKSIGFLKFEKLFDNSAWHTAVVLSKKELFVDIYKKFTSKKPENVLFSQDKQEEDLSGCLLTDCISTVNWVNIVKFAHENNLFPILFDETDSLEKIWYTNTKNKEYGTIKCAL